LGLDARQSKEVKTGSDMAESSKVMDKKMAILPMIMMD
jgi:hypothetical protein